MSDDVDDTVPVVRRVRVALTEVDTEATVLVQRPPRSTIESYPESTVADRRDFAVEKPANLYYAFRIGLRSGSVVLDQPCVIGRRPRPPRIPVEHPPRLLKVPSPLKEVSATHLEVRQLGASVIVTDLKSTNGSIVMVPGSVPRKLRPGESVVVSPGTLVDIGDENILQILNLQSPV